MSLNLALSSAVSSLLVLQQQMAVASNNIANANTEGYSKQTVDVAAKVTAGTGTGVEAVGILTYVDRFLLSSVIAAGGKAGEADVRNDYLNALQKSLGTISTAETGGSDLASLFSTLENRLSDLASNPEISTLKYEAVNALDGIVRTIRAYSQEIQDQRTQANFEVASTVDDVNVQLHKISDLNRKIAEAEARNEPTASFEDERMAALKALGEDVSINYFYDSRNQVNISIAGLDVLFGTEVREIDYTASPTMADGSVLSPIMLGGVDITTKIAAGSGKLSGLVNIANTDFVDIQDSLNAYANHLITTINAAYGGTLLTGTSGGDIALDATILSDPSQLQTGASGAPGDSSIAQAMVDALLARSTLNGADATLGGHASNFIASVTSKSVLAQDMATSKSATLNTLKATLSGKSGVNSDEESASLVMLQNAYASSSKIISTVRDMFQSLLSAVG